VDTRRKKHHIPVAFRVMQAFLDVGFVLREDVIKHQWKMKRIMNRSLLRVLCRKRYSGPMAFEY
jgi:hypothetical protein